MIGRVLVQVSLSVAITLPTLVGHEALRTVPYIDIAGNPTVCVGETKGVEDRTYTRSECLLLLAQRVANDFEKPLMRCTDSWDKLPIQAQSASLNLAYNIGTKAYCTSTARKMFDAGNWAMACDAFLLFNKITVTVIKEVDGVMKKVKVKKVSKGLVNRRSDERALCLEGVAVSV